jgi:hypothetical protein
MLVQVQQYVKVSTAQLDAFSNAAGFVWTPAATLNSNSIPDPLASPVQTTKYIVIATTGICTQKDSLTVICESCSQSKRRGRPNDLLWTEPPAQWIRWA